MEESNVKTAEVEQIELISRIAHINAKLEVCQPYTQKSFANCYEAGFKMAANWLFDSNSQLQSHISKLEARNKELEVALIATKDRLKLKCCNGIIDLAAINTAEQALNKK